MVRLIKEIGFIVIKGFLAILYLLFVVPSGLLAKMGWTKDLFQLSKKSNASYFTERNHTYSQSDFEN